MANRAGSLGKYIEDMRAKKDILLMTHQIIGYPSMGVNIQALKVFQKAGVELVELQIPFSDPVADGPLFVKSNQMALESGIRVEDCLHFAENVVKDFDFKVLIMTYYNIVFKYGEKRFFQKLSEIGIAGVIVPDIPVEEHSTFYECARQFGIDAVAIATPYTDEERLREISEAGEGFIYYVPRKGVTGTRTKFSDDTDDRIDFVKKKTGKAVAVGFGIQSKEDVDALKGKADIAIIGSKLQMELESGGVDGLERFVASLR